jgi:hypothetical protein
MATNTFVEIDLPEAQNLADYTGIAFDLRTARDFATTALAENRKPQPNDTFSDPLMVATTIRYARAFVGGVRIKVYEEVGFILTDQQRSKHESIINMRHKYIAHSVNAFEESQPIARYWVETVKEEGIDSIECNHSRIIGLSERDYEDIIELASAWLRYVEPKIKDEKVRLLPIVRKIPLEQLLQGVPRVFLPDASKPQKRRLGARPKLP